MLQSCPTLCGPIGGSPPGSPVPGILQARTLEWVAISFSNAWKWKVKVKSLSRVWFLGTPCNAAYQAPPPMGFSKQEYWSGLPLPSPATNTNIAQITSYITSLLFFSRDCVLIFTVFDGVLLKVEKVAIWEEKPWFIASDDFYDINAQWGISSDQCKISEVE